MRTIRQLLAIVLTFSSISFSYAEQVAFNIEAVIDHIYDPNNALADQLKSGDSLTSIYTFDISIPDSANSPVYGFYNQVSSEANGFTLIIKNLSRSPITPQS